MYSSYLSFYIYSLHFLKHGTFRSRFLIGAYQFSALTVRRQIYLERDKIRLWHTDAQFGKGELLFCLRATLRRDFVTYSRTRCHLHCCRRLRRPHVCVCPHTLLPASFHPAATPAPPFAQWPVPLLLLLRWMNGLRCMRVHTLSHSMRRRPLCCVRASFTLTLCGVLLSSC